MSGFITIYNTDGEPVQPRLLSSLTQSLKHRGPDKQNIWFDEYIGMGHALFKTTYEAEYENQPATIDNKVWITCSARIDDRKNLVNKLGMKNKIDLSKTSDSELILHAYKKWNENCLKHILGDFAFTIWDSKEQKLFCAKDRFGMRQLYYTQQKNCFIIGNSLNTIMKHPSINKQFNNKTIAGFLLFGDHYWLDPTLTAFQNIHTIKPAHCLIIKNGTYIVKRYWDISSNISMLHYKKDQDYIEHFQEVFQTAVDDRIRTSSIVISMSGGMDSSTIAAMVNRLRTKKTFEVHAVTAIYKNLIPDNEQYYANLVTKHLNIPIHFISGDKFPMIKSQFTTTSPTQLISPDFWFEIRKTFLQYSRVTLAGYAGDNALRSSSIHSTFKEMNPIKLIVELRKAYHRYGHIPSLGFGIKRKLKQIIHSLTNQQIPQYPPWIASEFGKNINLKELLYQEAQYEIQSKDIRHPEAYDSLLDANWNSDEVLYTSPLTLPEVRDPFLDTRVIELLFSFPSLPWFYNKHILRSSMKDILPPIIINRPKSVIGNLSYAYLQQPQNNWVDTHSFIKELSTYINATNIPPLTTGVSNPTLSDINIRPFHLNEWMKSIMQLNE